jgi:hypothetical protein
MSYRKTLIAASALALFAAPMAQADEAKDMTQTGTTAQMQSETTAVKMEERPEVRAAIAKGDIVRVTDEDGKTYLNRFIPVEVLPDPTLDVETLNTVTYEYQGRVYTNRNVRTD